MRTLISTVLLFMITSIGLAQETPPAGSAERGHQTFMKYMCYTCHGTLGQGADRGTGPKLAPGSLPYPAFALQVRTPRLSPAAKDIPLLKFD